jgi:hypothetical protein
MHQPYQILLHLAARRQRFKRCGCLWCGRHLGAVSAFELLRLQQAFGHLFVSAWHFAHVWVTLAHALASVFKAEL